MKVLILAGGKGTRFLEETFIKPKPMIEICGTPLLIHIINHYSHFGLKEFIILAGYKHEYIFEYFKKLDYQFKNDIFLTKDNLKIQILNTGEDTLTGGRVKQAQDLVGDTFLLTYGDGLANVNILNLIKFHNSNNALATVTAVRPPARFGSLTIDGSKVVKFGEKLQSSEGWINGGFFVLNRKVIEYIESYDTAFESEPLEQLSKSSNLNAFKHDGFWFPVDTLREKINLESFVKSNNGILPWKND